MLYKVNLNIKNLYFQIIFYLVIKLVINQGVSIQFNLVECVHSDQAVIAHTCHGHTVQLSTGLSV